MLLMKIEMERPCALGAGFDRTTGHVSNLLCITIAPRQNNIQRSAVAAEL
jgi:hypothetical protein